MHILVWRIMPRCLALLGLTLLAALLGGCTVRMGFFVRNSYPFAVSIRDANEVYGTVLSGQQSQMSSGLSRYGPAHLEICDLQGRLVRRVGISQNQIDRIYMTSKRDVAAVFLSVGPNSVSVVEVEDQRRAVENKVGQAVVLIGPLVIFMGLVFRWFVAYVKSNKVRRGKRRLAP